MVWSQFRLAKVLLSSTPLSCRLVFVIWRFIVLLFRSTMGDVFSSFLFSANVAGLYLSVVYFLFGGSGGGFLDLMWQTGPEIFFSFSIVVKLFSSSWTWLASSFFYFRWLLVIFPFVLPCRSFLGIFCTCYSVFLSCYVSWFVFWLARFWFFIISLMVLFISTIWMIRDAIWLVTS